MRLSEAIKRVDKYRDSIVSHPATSEAMTVVVKAARDENPYRAEMLRWAESLEAESAPMGPLLALEVRTRVARVDNEGTRK